MRLNVQRIGSKLGYNMSSLQNRINQELPPDQGVALTTVRRYWYGTSNGKQHGPPLRIIDTEFLARVAAVFDVPFVELFDAA